MRRRGPGLAGRRAAGRPRAVWRAARCVRCVRWRSGGVGAARPRSGQLRQSAARARRRRACSADPPTRRPAAMDHLIETVRKYPCLWNTTAIEYRDQELKDAAWAEVMKETDLSSGEPPLPSRPRAPRVHPARPHSASRALLCCPTGRRYLLTSLCRFHGASNALDYSISACDTVFP